jgi:hypothetical protein
MRAKLAAGVTSLMLFTMPFGFAMTAAPLATMLLRHAPGT